MARDAHGRPVSSSLEHWDGIEGMGLAILTAMRKEAEIKVTAAGALFAGEIKRTLSGPRHGRVYYIPSQARGRRKHPTTYTASAPGEAPAVMLGNLRNSIGFTPPVWEGWTVSVSVGPGLGLTSSGVNVGSYAKILEWGGVTSKGVRILPRPYIEPTAIRVEPQITKLMAT